MVSSPSRNFEKHAMFPIKMVLGLFIALNAIALATAATFYCIHSDDTVYKETRGKDMSENLNFELDFAFFTHGWKSSFNVSNEASTHYKVGLAWVKAKKTNFCGVDWRVLASAGYLDAARNNIHTVGKEIAEFIESLLEKSGKTADSVSIAGHSLGAHVSGIAGRTVYQATKRKISAIYGLDAAAPIFTTKLPLIAKSNATLSKGSAKFVQVLHTTSSLGTTKNIGHADFIANDGNVQEACLLQAKDDAEVIACSHSFATVIFLSSFTHSCTGHEETDGKDVYGIKSKKRHGVFKLKTSDSEPYCTGK